MRAYNFGLVDVTSRNFTKRCRW